jgi:hypothetical protein
MMMPEVYRDFLNLQRRCWDNTLITQRPLSSTRSRDSSVGIATGYWLDGQGSIPGRGKRFFSTPQRPDHASLQIYFLTFTSSFKILSNSLYITIHPIFFLYGAAAHIGPWHPLYEVP